MRIKLVDVRYFHNATSSMTSLLGSHIIQNDQIKVFKSLCIAVKLSYCTIPYGNLACNNNPNIRTKFLKDHSIIIFIST